MCQPEDSGMLVDCEFLLWIPILGKLMDLIYYEDFYYDYDPISAIDSRWNILSDFLAAFIYIYIYIWNNDDDGDLHR